MPEIIDQAALIGRVIASLARDAPMPIYDSYSPVLVPVEPAAFAMVVGAGFSVGAVPLVAELMRERIGDYYFPDPDMSSLERPPSVCRKNSARFWREFNAMASQMGRAEVVLNNRHLPVDCAAAYNRLFDYEVANGMFADHGVDPAWYRGRIGKLRRALGHPPPAAPAGNATLGSRFVRGFLRYVLAPGVEHGHGVTGRSSQQNAAHAQLAALLAAQQAGQFRALQPFCRTILTTNFDSLLQSALAVEQVIPTVSDRPERGFDAAMFEPAIGPIHIVHLHGSVLRDNPASSSAELSELARTNAGVLADYLATRHVLVVGHSGWNDAFVAALRLRETDRPLYWCDMAAAPSDRISDVLGSGRRPAVYVQLGPDGADALMTALVEALRAAQPVLSRPR